MRYREKRALYLSLSISLSVLFLHIIRGYGNYNIGPIISRDHLWVKTARYVEFLTTLSNGDIGFWYYRGDHDRIVQ
ncbi:hypothetical protein [Candidatus Anaplasma sp. TIGMIC]|uniref:hypothetical protein n=1 Tax=Candidatus Anaplasma sp. TIGMIC TaxID=3020713 RepID=UPI00232B6357|nr:hypothetical protein [Candidatus Anaplasma sp. TIGMIC]